MDADKAREVLGKHLGIGTQWLQGYVQIQASEAVSAMLAFAATARTDALREAAEKVREKGQELFDNMQLGSDFDSGKVSGCGEALSAILSLIKEPTQ